MPEKGEKCTEQGLFEGTTHRSFLQSGPGLKDQMMND